MKKGFSPLRLILFWALALVACFGAVWIGPNEGGRWISLQAQAAPGDKALGAGACASTECHGSPEARPGRVAQNEYRRWSTEDLHSKAYDVLLNQRSRSIARNLGLEAAEKDRLCLDCHTHNVPDAQRAPMFNSSEGVGCEACHGNSSNWLGTHAAGDADRAELGMADGRPIESQTRLCLSCHLGSGRRQVGHRLIAAGHPDLAFEFDTFTALMPAHWKVEGTRWQGVRRWAMGQVTALGASMRLLAQRAAGDTWNAWPDFSDFECSGCHHSLRPEEGGPEDFKPSPRQARGFEGTPGLPHWDASRYLVLRQFLQVTLPRQAGALDSRVKALRSALQRGLLDRERVRQSALALAAACDDVLPSVESLAYDEALVRKTVTRISRSASSIASGGRRAAEQAVMALDSLHAALSANSRAPQPLDDHIDQLYSSLQTASRYDPGRFATLLSRTASKLE